MGELLALLGFVALITGGPYWLLCRYEHNQKNTWKLAAEGLYDHSVAKSSVIAARRLRNMGLLAVTTVFFQDGKTWPIRGVIFSPPPPGTRIRIYKNGFGESRIETDETA